MRFNIGDYVIYNKPKASDHPSSRAEDLSPAPHGDMYSYQIKKFWRVSGIIDNETIEVKTRRGKTHQLRIDDPFLKKAGIFARLRYHGQWDPVTDDDN